MRHYYNRSRGLNLPSHALAGETAIGACCAAAQGHEVYTTCNALCIHMCTLPSTHCTLYRIEFIRVPTTCISLPCLFPPLRQTGNLLVRLFAALKRKRLNTRIVQVRRSYISRDPHQRVAQLLLSDISSAYSSGAMFIPRST